MKPKTEQELAGFQANRNAETFNRYNDIQAQAADIKAMANFMNQVNSYFRI
jgi:hypothetical protein